MTDSAASAAGEQFQHAPTMTMTSCLDHLPRHNNNRRKERRYDNCDAVVMTDQKAQGLNNFITTDQTTSRLKLSTLPIFIFNTIFATTFLHNVLIMFSLRRFFTTSSS
jgi:hypothetical protein